MHCFRRLVFVMRDSLKPGVFPISSKKMCKSAISLNFNDQYSSLKTEESDSEETEYQEVKNHFLGSIADGHRVFLIQPYIKWGEAKKRKTTPTLQLAEAEALIRTLPRWIVAGKECIPLLSLERKKLMGSGTLERLKARIKNCDYITALFVSIDILKLVQINELRKEFGLPVYDRYSVVIHIFRLHAKSPEAKLQVAIAEIPYIWKKIVESNIDGKKINLEESKKRLLQSHQGKLRKELKKLQERRHLIRRKRQIFDIPSVAIVGYTNCGKTSLIKALTGDLSLTPKNQLFATLDTTAYEGSLPSRLKVIYIDTIGFIQDVPEGLLAPFAVTFEDAIVADVIVHVYDVSHPDKEAQVDHVRDTLKSLLIEGRPVIEIANKSDLVEKDSIPKGILAISAKNLMGIDLLRRRIEEEVLRFTRRIHIRMRVASGSDYAAWLYRELTVTHTEPDPENPQYLFVDVIATAVQVHKFKRFLRE